MRAFFLFGFPSQCHHLSQGFEVFVLKKKMGQDSFFFDSLTILIILLNSANQKKLTSRQLYL